MLRGGLGRSEFGGPYGHRMEMMTQFDAQVPHPLADDLPDLLPTGGVGTPAVGILYSKPLRNIASLTIVSKAF